MRFKFRYCVLALLLASQVGVAQKLDTPDDFGEIKNGYVEVVPLSKTTTSEAELNSSLQRFNHQKQHGWIEVSEEEVDYFDQHFTADNPMAKGSESMVDVIENLSFDPMDLSGSVLANAELVRAIPAGGFVNGGWTGLVRTMRDPVLGDVVLVEYDYVKAGSHIKVSKETVDHELAGKPVMHFVWRSPKSSYSEIRWFTKNKDITLMVRGEIESVTMRKAKSAQAGQKEQIVEELKIQSSLL